MVRQSTSAWVTKAERRRIYEAVVEGDGLAVAAWRPNGRFVYVNRALCRLTGYETTDLRGIFLSNIIQAPERRAFQDDILDRLSGSGPVSGETTLRKQDGSLLPVSISSVKCRPEGKEKQLIASTFRSATDMHATLAGLLQTERLSAMGTILAGMSHELNNPLSVICGYAELAVET